MTNNRERCSAELEWSGLTLTRFTASLNPGPFSRWLTRCILPAGHDGEHVCSGGRWIGRG